MENKKASIWKNSINYGLMTGLVIIIYSVILYVFNLNLNKGLGYINYVIIIAGIVMGTKNLRDKIHGGNLSYGRGLGSGTLISIFAGIITAIYTFVLMKYIDPDMIEKIFIMMEDGMISQGMPDEQIEIAMMYSKKFTTPNMMLITTIPSYAFMGFLLSLITSAILKKKVDPFDAAMANVETETKEN